jgi:hypothetical protein
VAAIGADRSRRKPEYGSKCDTGWPVLMLKILTRCFCVPLCKCQIETGASLQVYLRCENGCMLMNTQSSQMIRCC